MLEHLLALAPPQLVVVLATRVDPPLPLGRLRVRGELVEVLELLAREPEVTEVPGS